MVIKQIVDMLGTDGKADGVRFNTGLEQFIFRHLGVRGARRMDDQRFDVGHIGEQGENLKTVNKIPCFLCAVLNLKSKDRTCAVREILPIQGMVRTVGK
ncbi:hypothetical protein CAGA_16890 [Caproiciproducens galactitolivorans]|uniref:Uncharacterized protein n=1 Tax=Caproiciproducens galactitolivorans TaxID=642589 RepID=A0A4Z0YES4_9FIRM|nr:hypothetical protein CAGA_16890 [Caproiciproducens galactitolivorans]